MSQKIQFFLVICIAVAIGFLIFTIRQPQAPIVQDIQITQPEKRSITVVGTGEMKVKPDTVEFVIVIDSDDKDLANARMQNEKTFLKVMAVLDSHAVEKKDINSDYLRISTEASNTRIYKYIVNKSIKVTLHDLTGMEPLLTDLQEAGVGQIKDMEFSISQLNSYYGQTLQLAIQVAEEKAKAAAAGMGLEIGKPISVLETPLTDQSTTIHYGDISSYSPEYLYLYSNLQSVSYTEITLKTQVTVTFELK